MFELKRQLVDQKEAMHSLMLQSCLCKTNQWIKISVLLVGYNSIEWHLVFMSTGIRTHV